MISRSCGLLRRMRRTVARKSSLEWFAWPAAAEEGPTIALQGTDQGGRLHKSDISGGAGE